MVWMGCRAAVASTVVRRKGTATWHVRGTMRRPPGRLLPGAWWSVLVAPGVGESQRGVVGDAWASAATADGTAVAGTGGAARAGMALSVAAAAHTSGGAAELPGVSLGALDRQARWARSEPAGWLAVVSAALPRLLHEGISMPCTILTSNATSLGSANLPSSKATASSPAPLAAAPMSFSYSFATQTSFVFTSSTDPNGCSCAKNFLSSSPCSGTRRSFASRTPRSTSLTASLSLMSTRY